VKRHDWLALGLCAFFAVLASLWISKPGIHADEASLATAIWNPEHSPLAAWFFDKRISLMQLSYLGSLKAWLYTPIFALLSPSAAVLRIPMILAGALTLWVIYLLLRDAVSPRAGLLALTLLAADPSYLWTTRCDWGPVALQHLLTTAGALAFYRRRHTLGAFLFGLALWDKAVFIWTLAALALSVVLLYRKQLIARLRPAALILVTAAFLLGAYPLLRYNVTFRGSTASDTVHLAAESIPEKAGLLASTLNGGRLFGYLVRDRDAGPKSTYAWLLLVACAVAWPLWRRHSSHRAAWFFLLLSTFTWLFMAVTKGGAESVHHLVLLWPWPHCFMAVALAALPKRAGLIPAAAVGLLSLAVTANYYNKLRTHGADVPWSEAIYPLHEEIQRRNPAVLYVTDWGILQPLTLLSAGRLPIQQSFAQIEPDPDGLYVAHTDPHQEFPDANGKLEVPGFRRQLLQTISDPQGEPIYELFRYLPAQLTEGLP